MTLTETPEARVDLALEGMTCAACATRIERKLNKLEGVEASVNYATEQAAVRYDSDRVAVADLVGRSRPPAITLARRRTPAPPRIARARCARGSPSRSR